MKKELYWNPDEIHAQEITTVEKKNEKNVIKLIKLLKIMKKKLKRKSMKHDAHIRLGISVSVKIKTICNIFRSKFCISREFCNFY